MKEIQFKEKIYSVPTCWDEVTVRMLVKSWQLTMVLPDAPVVTIMSAYSGIPIKELTEASITAVQEIMGILEFIYTEYQAVPRYSFEFRGEQYSCASNIVDQSFGDYVSIQTILYNYRDEPVNGLSRMLAVLCKKEGETIETLDLNARQELFLDLPMTTARDVERFFLNSQESLLILSRLFSAVPEMEKSIRLQLKELRHIMNKRLEGIGGFSRTRFQIGYYRIYLWYLESLLEKYFNSRSSDSSKRKWNQTVKNLFTKVWKRKRNK